MKTPSTYCQPCAIQSATRPRGEKMTTHYPTRDGATLSPSKAPGARLHYTHRPVLRRSTRVGTLCALVGLAGSVLIPPAAASAASVGSPPFAPGSVVVSQGGTIFGGTNTGSGVELNGEV